MHLLICFQCYIAVLSVLITQFKNDEPVQFVDIRMTIRDSLTV